MISFKDVTQIEHIRRQIEALQEDLTAALNVSFHLIGLNKAASPDLNLVLRDALKKYTVAKIVVLLDEAARLGVDTAEQRELLVEYLKPEEPAS